MHRWNALAVITSFLMLVIVYKSKKSARSIKVSRLIYPIIVFLVFLGGVSSVPLYDYYYVKNFPFPEHQQYIIDIIREKEEFPYVPTR